MCWGCRKRPAREDEREVNENRAFGSRVGYGGRWAVGSDGVTGMRIWNGSCEGSANLTNRPLRCFHTSSEIIKRAITLTTREIEALTGNLALPIPMAPALDSGETVKALPSPSDSRETVKALPSASDSENKEEASLPPSESEKEIK